MIEFLSVKSFLNGTKLGNEMVRMEIFNKKHISCMTIFQRVHRLFTPQYLNGLIWNSGFVVMRFKIHSSKLVGKVVFFNRNHIP